MKKNFCASCTKIFKISIQICNSMLYFGIVKKVWILHKNAKHYQ